MRGFLGGVVALLVVTFLVFALVGYCSGDREEETTEEETHPEATIIEETTTPVLQEETTVMKRLPATGGVDAG